MKNFIIVSLLSIVLIIFYFIFSNRKYSILIPQNNSIVSTEITKENKNDEYQSPISINYLRNLKINETELTIENQLASTSSYKQYIVSYKSEGYKVFGLLTIPLTPKPENGFPAIIFNHGYIPPKAYSTTRNYTSYVDYLARNDFVVLKIDMRGHGNSEGTATGSYFSNTYTIDVLSALNALQKFEEVDKENIGIWGHSMGGNLVLRTLLVNSEFKAGVIWAGAVYSYEDFAKYRISDRSYMAPITQPGTTITQLINRETSPEVSKIRTNPKEINFSSDFWKSISLTHNIGFLNTPIQIHHAVNDDVVNVGYSRDLVKVLQANNKNHEYLEYQFGGHNIAGVDFNRAMSKTVEFFNKYLKNNEK